ncbi:MAG: hypothetical protein ACRDIA_03395, partial [Actinomycetota bacterium]
PQLESSAEAPGEATFQVVVKQVQTKRLPAADDEFAKLASEFDTLEELKAELRSRIEAAKKERANAEVREAILDALIEETDPPVPQAMIDADLQARLARLVRELERNGLNLDQYLQASGQSQDDLIKETTQASRITVAGDLVLDAVAEAEEIKVTREDIAHDIAVLAQQTGTDPEEMAKNFADAQRVNMLAGDILRRKALSFLVEHAEIADEDGPAPEQEISEPLGTQEP